MNPLNGEVPPKNDNTRPIKFPGESGPPSLYRKRISAFAEMQGIEIRLRVCLRDLMNPLEHLGCHSSHNGAF